MSDDAPIKSSSLSKFNFFLMITIGIAVGISCNWLYEKTQKLDLIESKLTKKIRLIELRQKQNSASTDNLKSSIKDILFDKYIEGLNQTIDFTTASIQDIGDGFMLTRASQEQHLTGIKFKGRILNTQSVRHTNVTFQITANKIKKDFTINKISSGNSTSFNVYIPDIKAENARYVKLKYKESTVEYYVK